ncbi:hypothetical protein TRFO_38076 [Tritrichomonas foetus]|uniref:Protein kinase domain-containing protein n=1 Tax=Tritrichomonas foetus TaxID=1144522 RepID=A0A1J4JDM7_9EUKA|nr:hypothetical protein TRFO_38076 [Tritrichomonas foetus]|eukprot:OHS95779.1 hypothetical protein TRFO_38076 [Tritrichomonas foetus]
MSSISDYNLQHMIGCGSTGTVYLASHKLLNIPVAIKKVDLCLDDFLSTNSQNLDQNQTQIQPNVLDTIMENDITGNLTESAADNVSENISKKLVSAKNHHRNDNKISSETISIALSSAEIGILSNNPRFLAIKKEAEFALSLNNQFIAKYFDVFVENGSVYIVMEYIPNGSLYDMITKIESPFQSHLKADKLAEKKLISKQTSPNARQKCSNQRNCNIHKRNCNFHHRNYNNHQLNGISPVQIKKQQSLGVKSVFNENNQINVLSAKYASDDSLNILEMLISNSPQEKKFVDDFQVFHYFRQICSAVEYLHVEKKIVHRDLKAENILIDNHNNIKLIDFGFCRNIDKNLMKTRCGSPCYSSPELIVGEGYTEKTDIWSLGIVLYFLTTGKVPFCDENIQKLFGMIVNDEVKFPEELIIDPRLIDLICLLLNKDPMKRPSITDIFHSEWFKKFNIASSLSLPNLNNFSEINEMMKSFNLPSNLKPKQLEVIKRIVIWDFHHQNTKNNAFNTSLNLSDSNNINFYSNYGNNFGFYNIDVNGNHNVSSKENFNRENNINHINLMSHLNHFNSQINHKHTHMNHSPSTIHANQACHSKGHSAVNNCLNNMNCMHMPNSSLKVHSQNSQSLTKDKLSLFTHYLKPSNTFTGNSLSLNDHI